MKSTAKPSSRLEVLDLLQDLALHDDVERGRRLVEDHELGAERERHRDDHALAHAARQLVRVGARAPRVDADEVEQLARALRARRCFEMCSCARIMSTNWSPTRITGLSAFIALWKTIETFRQRIAAQLLGLAPDEVVAAEEDAAADDRAAGGRRICMTVFAIVRLAAAGLAGEAEDLAGRDREVDAVDRDARRRRRPRGRAPRRASRASRLGRRWCRLDHGHCDPTSLLPPASCGAAGC